MSVAAPPAVAATVTSAGVGCLAGAIAGLIWGGVGGRLAMRLLLVTSDDRVRGVTSDDGFAIGRVSADTLVLLVICTVLGAMAGIGYGLLRMALRGPLWLVATGVAAVAGATAGSAIVHDDGIDFILLEPLWLAVALFVAIPAAWGASVVLLTQRLLRPGALYARPPAGIDARIGGGALAVAAWALVASLAAVGVADLHADLRALA